MITQIDDWSLFRSEEDYGVSLLLRNGRGTFDGICTLETLPEEFKKELSAPENGVQFALLLNYFKLFDRFAPILTEECVRHYLEKHPGGPVPGLPTYGEGGRTFVYWAEAMIDGNPLYRITCVCPLARGCRCHAEPAR
jgi:hypothetical protein